MDFEFKHIVFTAAMLCAAWGIAVSSMVGFDEHTAGVSIKSELSQSAAIPSPFQFVDKFHTVSQTLNVVLPLGLLCIAFLIYTYRTNPIGAGSLLILLVVFSFASVSAIDAAEVVVIGATEKAELAQIVWWMPGRGGA